MTIDSTQLHDHFVRCFYRITELTVPDELPAEAVTVQGVAARYGLHPARVEDTRAFVTEALAELSDDFRGGASFLNLCQDRHGDMWTDSHRSVEQLCVLAIALGLAKWAAPHAMWHALPGGMPYLTIHRASDGARTGSENFN